MAAKLIIVCGLPGAGKTTHARRLEAQQRAVRFCPDEWMLTLDLNLFDAVRREKVEQFQWQLARRLLTLGQTVAIEWGTWGRDERDRLRDDARALGASAELHYLSAPLDVLFDRVSRRGMENPPIKYADMASWAELIQVPTDEEYATYDRVVRIEA